MNKAIIKGTFAIMLMLLSLLIQGQTFNGAIITGLNFSRTHEVGLGFRKVGLTLGGKTEVEIVNNILLEMQIVYNQKGHVGYKDSLTDYPSRLRLEYIEVPLLVNYIFKEKKLRFGFGLSTGTLINYKRHIDGEEIVYKTNPYNKKDYSLVFSGNYFLSEHININLIYTHQLNYVFEKDINTCIGIRINYNFIKVW